IASASLASGRAVPIGAECGCGVHDAPPGCAWKHCHEEYVWTPVCFTTSPHHGLVWGYQREKSPDLPQIKLLKQSREREVGLQPQPDVRDMVEQDILLQARPMEQGAITLPK